MRRWIAVLWQSSFFVIAGVLYFLFVLPRWNELTGDWSHSLGTAMRIVAGVLIGLSALPVVFTLIKTRKPEYGTPALALALRMWSVVLLVLGGVLIVGTAVAEIWVSLASAGQWLFGIYGAAAAIAILGTLAFHLAFVAEMPPPPPKPLKSKQRTRGRGRRKAAVDADSADEAEDAVDADAEDAEEESPTEDTPTADDEPAETVEAPVPVAAAETVEAPIPAAETVEAPIPAAETVERPIAAPDTDEASGEEDATEETTEEKTGKLRNRRPSGKSSSRLRRRSRGGVALDD